MTTVAHVLQDVGCSTEVGEQRNPRGESVQFYHFRRKPTHFFCSSFIFALLLLSNLYLRAYSIPEIVAKAKPAIVEILAIDAAGAPMKFGTGFFISPAGSAVTNFHVIDGAASLKAIGTDGSIFAFQRLVAQGTGVDLALLQFQVTGVPFLRLGTSADKVEGERVIVIGNPTGFTGTVSDGVISAFREKRSMIQISAPISLGSSGSPVLDAGGRVIGVATLIAKEGQNLNFAIAVEQLSTVLSSQGIALPKAEITNQDIPGGTGRIARLTPTVLMVTAKSMNVTFQENGGSLVFFGNGRSVAASIAKPESTEIGHTIRFEPGLTRSSTGESYLPYPLALTIQAFLDPDIRPEFAPNHFYLVNASGSQESQKTETLMSALSRVNPKLFIITERTEQVPTVRAVQLFVRIIPPQTGGPDCAVSAMIFALPGPVDQNWKDSHFTRLPFHL